MGLALLVSRSLLSLASFPEAEQCLQVGKLMAYYRSFFYTMARPDEGHVALMVPLQLFIVHDVLREG